MGWFRGGCYGTWYAAFAGLFAHWAGDHPSPLMLALGCLAFAPALLLTICMAVDDHVTSGLRRTTVAAVVGAGGAGRGVAVAAGALGAVAGMAFLALAGGMVQAVGIWGLPLVPAAPVAGWWVGMGGLTWWAGPTAARPEDGPGSPETSPCRPSSMSR